MLMWEGPPEDALPQHLPFPCCWALRKSGACPTWPLTLPLKSAHWPSALCTDEGCRDKPDYCLSGPVTERAGPGKLTGSVIHPKIVPHLPISSISIQTDINLHVSVPGFISQLGKLRVIGCPRPTHILFISWQRPEFHMKPRFLSWASQYFNLCVSHKMALLSFHSVAFPTAIILNLPIPETKERFSTTHFPTLTSNLLPSAVKSTSKKKFNFVLIFHPHGPQCNLSQCHLWEGTALTSLIFPLIALQTILHCTATTIVFRKENLESSKEKWHLTYRRTIIQMSTKFSSETVEAEDSGTSLQCWRKTTPLSTQNFTSAKVFRNDGERILLSTIVEWRD